MSQDTPPPGQYPPPYGPAGNPGPPWQPSSPFGPYASWGKRVGAALIDVLAVLPTYVVIFAGLGIAAAGAPTQTYDATTGTFVDTGGNGALVAIGIVLSVIGYVGAFAVALWNQVFRQGRTGWSLGKQVLGIRLVKEDTGQPMGAGMCFVRQLAHLLDGLPCYLGYLWPLWDDKKQTFADKLMSTVVVDQPKPQQ